MSQRSNWVWQYGLVAAVAVCGLTVASVGRYGNAAQDVTKAKWQYRAVESIPNSVQATMDDLGREGWEVFNVYGAATLNNEGGQLKMVPHTFHIFARRQM